MRPSVADRMWDDQQSSHGELSCMSACKIFSRSGAIALGKSIV